MLLNKISTPKDFKHLNSDQLLQLCKEVYDETVRIVSKNGGHLGASLGVIELTVALHHVFNTPKDKIIWDVGHQTYPHKILTGRRKKMEKLRQENGISGFTKRSESEYDPFGAGHSSTSISAGLGMEIGNALKNKKNDRVVSVIGDGAMSAGMAFEALNNAGALKNKLIVVLNDNKMSISPAVGAFSSYLSKIVSSERYLNIRDSVKNTLEKIPGSNFIKKTLKTIEQDIKLTNSHANVFEGLGFYYIGPIDGHNLEDLVKIFRNIQQDKNIHKPILVHILTEKGKGFNSDKGLEEKYHAVGKFCTTTGKQFKKNVTNPTYTNIFSNSLINVAKKDKDVVAITAAMESGTGLQEFHKKFPNRFFDVGIAEQHAVTFAAGLACSGLKPFVTIYSTFLQRAYDQIIHDVAIQNLPVKFAIDRAGLVGADGSTHAGSFDIAYLSILPNFVVMAPSSANELQNMVYTAANYNKGPIAFRFPRGEVGDCILDNQPKKLQIGKGKVIIEGKEVAILSYGARISYALQAAETLKQKHNISCTVADARFAKPIDEALVKDLYNHHKILITLEEGSIGGFGSIINDYLLNKVPGKNKISNIYLKDEFLNQASQERQHELAGISPNHIVSRVLDLLEK
ncbi:MAG: 1-deoxy-D-xylulose-5-phosphate synthase [Rickettsiales bacterium]